MKTIKKFQAPKCCGIFMFFNQMEHSLTTNAPIRGIYNCGLCGTVKVIELSKCPDQAV